MNTGFYCKHIQRHLQTVSVFLTMKLFVNIIPANKHLLKICKVLFSFNQQNLINFVSIIPVENT